MTRKLTIGMAHHTDFNGVYFTIQNIRLNNPDLIDQIEFLIVDNSPSTKDSDMVRGIVSHVTAGGHKIGYATTEESGTSPTRNMVFALAKTEYVMCIDCHVLLAPNTLRSLFAYYNKNPYTKDLIQGPMILDTMKDFHSHFNDEWRSEMWGTWGQGWQCSCANHSMFTCVNVNDKAQAIDLATNLVIQNCPCGRPIPSSQWPGHEAILLNNGFFRPSHTDSLTPYDVPGQGLGMFTCRKDAWLGFHPEARGFGGEEMYIHAKYRKNGHRSVVIPALKWLHRFGRPAGVPYPLTRWNKIRNYVLEFNELGMDLEPIRHHFVDSGLLPPHAWDIMVSDPVGALHHKAIPAPKESTSMANRPFDIEREYNAIRQLPRDLDKHMPKLKEFAQNATSIVEFSNRRESAIAFIAGRPKSFTSYNTDSDAVFNAFKKAYTEQGGNMLHASTMIDSIGAIPTTDLLFIDTKHTYETVSRQLSDYGQSVNRFIVLHDTQIYGINGEDGQKGILYAVTDFIKKNPKWTVIYHVPEQYGLTVLGCQKDDFPASPINLLLPPNEGPGTELKAILQSIGIVSSASCECNARANQMDVWGVAGCKMHKATIVEWMKEGHEKWGWKAGLAAAAKAIASGLAFKLNPLNPFPSLVDEAIHRAEKKDIDTKRQAEAALEAEYQNLCLTPSDINEHLPTLRRLAEKSSKVVELGVRSGVSTRALLMGRPNAMESFDINPAPSELQQFADLTGVKWKFYRISSLDVSLDKVGPIDLLFIDTLHNYKQLKAELDTYHESVNGLIAMHDTESFGDHDEHGDGPGLKKAITEFLEENDEWRILFEFKENNGLVVLGRVDMKDIE